MNMRVPDLPLDPPDDSVKRYMHEKAVTAAFNEYLADGWLPGNHDPSDVDDQMIEEIPEALDGLITAEDDAALLALAKQIRKKRIEVIESLIEENLGGDMSKWRVTDKAGWDERTGKAVYTVTKDSTSLNAGDQDELKALLAGWQPIETAPKDELVFLYSPPQSGDYPDDIRIDVDFFDSGDECWYNHNENREYFECVAPPGSVGPSVEAPYTHWRPYFTAPTN